MTAMPSEKGDATQPNAGASLSESYERDSKQV